jgi:hypothetical protein
MVIIIIGIIFNHSGSLHLVLIFGINQIIEAPEITDSIDMVIIGLITAGISTDEDCAL